MRKKKNYRRPDPFAINPEKVLAGKKKKTSEQSPELFFKPQLGPCMYCGSPGVSVLGLSSSAGKSFRCRDCRGVMHEFMRRPENLALLMELGGADKSKPERLRGRVEKMIEDMERYIRECAAKRK